MPVDTQTPQDIKPPDGYSLVQSNGKPVARPLKDLMAEASARSTVPKGYVLDKDLALLNAVRKRNQKTPATGGSISGYAPSTLEQLRDSVANSAVGYSLEQNLPKVADALNLHPSETVNSPTYEQHKEQLLAPEYATQAIAENSPVPLTQAGEERLEGALKGVGGLTSASNLALMGGTAVAAGLTAGIINPVSASYLSRAVSGGFTLDMLYGLYQQNKEYKKAIDSGNLTEAHKIQGEMGVNGIMAALTAHHALTSHPFTPIEDIPTRERTNVLHRNTAGEVRQANGQAPTVWLSPTAWESLMKTMYPNENHTSTHGFNLPIDLLHTFATDPTLAAAHPEAQQLLAEAHKNASKSGVAIASKTGRGVQHAVNVMREELNHTWQRQLASSGYFDDALKPGIFSHLRRQIPQGMYDHLLDNDYDGYNSPQIVTEAAAKLLGGNIEKYNVSPEEATEFLKSYLDEIVAEHGTKALDTLKHTRGAGNVAKEATLADHKGKENGTTNDGLANGPTDRGGLQGLPSRGGRAPESTQSTPSGQGGVNDNQLGATEGRGVSGLEGGRPGGVATPSQDVANRGQASVTGQPQGTGGQDANPSGSAVPASVAGTAAGTKVLPNGSIIESVDGGWIEHKPDNGGVVFHQTLPGAGQDNATVSGVGNRGQGGVGEGVPEPAFNREKVKNEDQLYVHIPAYQEGGQGAEDAAKQIATQGLKRSDNNPVLARTIADADSVKGVRLPGSPVVVFKGTPERTIGIDHSFGDNVPTENILGVVHPQKGESIQDAITREGIGSKPEALFNREKDKPVWYLKSERLIGEKMKGPMPAEDTHKMLLAGGVKPEEMHWTGLDDFLKSKGKEKVTPEEIREHLANNNLQIKEVVKGGPKPTYKKEELSVNQKESNNNAVWVVDAPGQVFQIAKSRFPNPDDAIAYIAKEKTRSDAPYVPDTQYEGYVLPEGTNYRELLITGDNLPVPKEKIETRQRLLDNLTRVKEGADKKFSELREAQGDRVFDWLSPAEQDALVEAHHRAEQASARLEHLRDQKLEADSYTSPHWDDEKNVLAHLRFNDRTGPNGEKLLHVEEVQSDWHQKGRDRGYKTDGGLDNAKLVAKEVQPGWYQVNTEDGRFVTNVTGAQGTSSPEAAIEEARRRIVDEPRRIGADNRVPDAPFKKTWHEMALRRALKYAAENGYDGVSWTGGAEQVARYPDELRKVVDRIAWTPASTETGDKFVRAYKDGQVVFKGTVDPEGSFRDYQAAGKHVDEIIGKSMGKRILEENGGDIAGKDFTVGGEGMKGFYDKIIPDYLNKFGKKFNAKVGDTEIPTDEVGTHIRVLKGASSGRFYIEDRGQAVGGKDYATREEAEAAAEEMKKTQQKKVQYLPITPEMRKSVTEEGVPLFNREQVKTPEFKKFFGDSKIVDKDGEPLVVYHGTTKDFDSFRDNTSDMRDGKEAPAVQFFSPHTRYAEAFTRGANGGSGEGGRIMPVYLKMENPFHTDLNMGVEAAHLPMSDETIAKLKKQGYDGMIYSKKGDITKGPSGWGDDSPQYVTFYPEQIKSAIGNNGKFDPTDPNILRNREKSPSAAGSTATLEPNTTEKGGADNPEPTDEGGTGNTPTVDNSDRHQLQHVDRKDAPAEVTAWDKDEASKWTGGKPSLQIVSQKDEELDPKTLKTTQPWAGLFKLKQFAGMDAGTAPPISVVRTSDGDYIVDGVHRATRAAKDGGKVKATVYTVKLPEGGQEKASPSKNPNANTLRMLTSGKEGAFDLNYWLKNQRGVNILSVQKESLDPSTLHRIQDWTREGKLADWKKANADVSKMPPVEVVRTASGDFLYDGTHRTEYATRQGEKVNATVYTIRTRDEAAPAAAVVPQGATRTTVLPIKGSTVLAAAPKQETVVPRTYYRGTNPDDARKITTGDQDWDSHLFAADQVKHAENYGRTIEQINLKPNAKVLVEGSKDFKKLVGNYKPGENMLSYSSRAAKLAKAAGYDLVHFQLQGTVGTAIMNRDAIESRQPYTSVKDLMAEAAKRNPTAIVP